MTYRKVIRGRRVFSFRVYVRGGAPDRQACPPAGDPHAPDRPSAARIKGRGTAAIAMGVFRRCEQGVLGKMVPVEKAAACIMLYR